MTKLFLHVGCGGARQAQTPFSTQSGVWHETRMDVDPAAEPDILGSMTDLSKIPAGSFDAVYSSHSIEHLYPHEVPVALAGFRRVLAQGGFALIACPDLQSVCALVAQGNLTETAYVSPAGPIAPLDILYGHRPSLAIGQSYMAHRTGFTLMSLETELRHAGFATVVGARREGPYFDLWAAAFVSAPADDVIEATVAAFFPT